MGSSRNPPWAEIIQLIPILSLALPFIAAGSVDMGQAGTGFVVGALLTIPVYALLSVRKRLFNPILVGTALWLWVGALAFQIPLEPLVTWLAQTQAFSLFVMVLLAGATFTVAVPNGFVACPSDDRNWQQKASLGLLALSVLAVGWAWWFRADIRLGGGLPFIVLNVARRVVCLRAPVPGATAGGQTAS